MLRIHNAVVIFFYYDQDVSSTSECVGFRDISYFSRIFKSYTGVSPLRFKKALARPGAKSDKNLLLLDPIIDFQRSSMDEAFHTLRNIQEYCDQVNLPPEAPPLT